MKKCPKCKMVFDDSWSACYLCGSPLKDVSDVQGERGLLSQPPRSRMLIFIFTILLMLITPFVIALIYISIFGDMGVGFTRHEGRQIGQAVYFEEEEAEKDDGK